MYHKNYQPWFTDLGDVNKLIMEFLEKGRFNGITFLGNGKVHNGYTNEVMLYEDYRKWAEENIY